MVADACEAFRASVSAGGKRRFGFASGSCWMTESLAEFGHEQTPDTNYDRPSKVLQMPQ